MNSAAAKPEAHAYEAVATLKADAAELTLGISNPLAWPTLAGTLVD